MSDNLALAAASSPSAATGTAPSGSEPEAPTFHLDVLLLVKQSQLSNGLRHSEYDRYHSYCSKRVHRLRVALKLTHARNNRDFKYKPVEPKQVTDSRHLLIPLTLSERSWAYAMQIKAEMDLNKELKRKRFHRLKCLARAAFWAAHFEHLCLERADSRTQLEAAAYSSMMAGTFALAKDLHEDALKAFVKARHVFEKLSPISSTIIQAICEEKVSSLDPLIRFCQYMHDRATKAKAAPNTNATASAAPELVHVPEELSDLISSKLERVINEQNTKNAEVIESIQWNQKKVTVGNDKLKAILGKAHAIKQQSTNANTSGSSEEKLSEQKTSVSVDGEVDEGRTTEEKARLHQYATLLGLYDDALTVLRDDLNEVKSDGATRNNLLALQQFLQAKKLSTLVNKNFLLALSLRQRFRDQERNSAAPPSLTAIAAAGDAASVTRPKKKIRPDELISLFDRIIQNSSDIIDIAKQAGFNELEKEQNIHVAIFSAFRCFYIAEWYRRSSKFSEAFALFQRVEQRATEQLKALNQPPQSPFTTADEWAAVKTQLAELAQDSRAQRAVVQAVAFLETAQHNSAVPSKVQQKRGKSAVAHQVAPLLDRVDKYESGDFAQHYHLVDFPPACQIAPAKPVLFDLALNAIQFPDLSDKIAALGPVKVDNKPAKVEEKKKETKTTSGQSKTTAPPQPTSAPAAASAASADSAASQQKSAGGFLSKLGLWR